MPFKMLEGVVMADAAFEAVGKDVDELFEQSALAVESVMVNLKSVKRKSTTTISLEKGTIENLLYEFLSELVFLKDAEQLLFSKVSVSVSKNKGREPNPVGSAAPEDVPSSRWLLNAKLEGDTINRTMKLGTDIKAITLHQFAVTEMKKQWKARVVVDV